MDNQQPRISNSLPEKPLTPHRVKTWLESAGYALLHRLYISRKKERTIASQFHTIFYDAERFGGTWTRTHWMGRRVLKNPLDLWIYQEILYGLRPDVIIETGTAHGGSALFFAQICDLLGHGRILSIDIERRSDGVPPHPRIEYFLGSSTAPATLDYVRSFIGNATIVLVFLDSDHHFRHVLHELRTFGPLVTMGSYLIVEDTNVNGHPVARGFGPGPMEAVEVFLRETHEFEVDASCEKYLLSFNPRGFLKRV